MLNTGPAARLSGAGRGARARGPSAFRPPGSESLSRSVDEFEQTKSLINDATTRPPLANMTPVHDTLQLGYRTCGRDLRDLPAAARRTPCLARALVAVCCNDDGFELAASACLERNLGRAAYGARPRSNSLRRGIPTLNQARCLFHYSCDLGMTPSRIDSQAGVRLPRVEFVGAYFLPNAVRKEMTTSKM